MSSPLTIFITGANQGLGFESARQLSKHPHIHLIISGRDSQRLTEAQENITAEEGCQARVETIVLDVSKDDSIEAAVAELKKKLGDAPLDVLINNAGVSLEFGKGPAKLRNILEDTYAVNVFGPTVLAEACLPLLKKSKEQGGGRIVNVSSGLGSVAIMADPNGQYKGVYLYAYNSSKSALNSVTVTLAMKNPDLHVVALDPGYNATNLNGFSGPKQPKDGVKVIVDHALKATGKSPGFYEEGGEVPW